jgi:predicted nuclease of predicted toxin-antitoxin system
VRVWRSRLTASANRKCRTREAFLDENLSPRLIEQLSDLYAGSAHVQQCGLGSADDATIWECAKSNGFSIVSKDSDFEERSILSASPPKLIWVRARNCTSAEVESLLRAAFSSVKRFVQEDEETCLILGPRQRNR